MADVRFLKIFHGYVKYSNILDIENRPSLETISAPSFPHTEHNLHVICLLKIPPKFFGEISGRITQAHVDLGAAWVQDTPNDITWLTFDKRLLEVTFPRAGEYFVEILLDGIPIHSITLNVRPK